MTTMYFMAGAFLGLLGNAHCRATPAAIAELAGMSFPLRHHGLPCGPLGHSPQLQTVAAHGQVFGVPQGRAARGVSFCAHGCSVRGRGPSVANNNSRNLI